MKKKSIFLFRLAHEKKTNSLTIYTNKLLARERNYTEQIEDKEDPFSLELKPYYTLQKIKKRVMEKSLYFISLLNYLLVLLSSHSYKAFFSLNFTILLRKNSLICINKQQIQFHVF